MIFNALALYRNDFFCVALGQGFDSLAHGQKGRLACHDCFDPIGQGFPLVPRQGKARAQIQDVPLPGASFGAEGLDQFEGMVLSSPLVFLGSAAQKHGVTIFFRARKVKGNSGWPITFCHYKQLDLYNLLKLLGRDEKNTPNSGFRHQKPMKLG